MSHRLYFVFIIEILSNSSPKSKIKTSVLGQGVDFVFPLSQQQQEQEQEQEPPPKSVRRGALEVCNLTHKLLRGFWLSLGG